MKIISGVVWISLGLAAMGFGLLLFYTLLPLFYALFGAGIGYWLGLAVTGHSILDAGLLESILAIVGAVIFAGVAHYLEPARRILVGIGAGVLSGLTLGYAFGADTLISLILAIAGGVVGGVVVPLAFDPLVIVTTAVEGAALVMDGANQILDLDILDRFNVFSGESIVPLVIWIVLAIVGIGWQFRNLERWVRTERRLWA